MKKRFYAVRKGHKSNIVVGSWDECRKLVDGFPGAVYKGFADYQHDEAQQFAKHGSYRGQSHKPKPAKKKSPPKSTWGPKYPCIERKDYTDTLTGVHYKNRCVRRGSGIPIRGKNFKPHIGNSVPWKLTTEAT